MKDGEYMDLDLFLDKILENVSYYKVMMKKLLDEAKENNVEVAVEDLFGLNHIFFRNETECTGVAIKSAIIKPPNIISGVR